MLELPKNEGLQRALRIGFGGILMVCTGIVWVFLRPEGTMFGVAEGLTVVGMLMIMAAAWKAAEATADESDSR